MNVTPAHSAGLDGRGGFYNVFFLFHRGLMSSVSQDPETRQNPIYLRIKVSNVWYIHREVLVAKYALDNVSHLESTSVAGCYVSRFIKSIPDELFVNKNEHNS